MPVDNTIEPIITVAIPSYNHAIFIERAIRSALNQDIQNIEIIVIDDASTDGSVEVVRALARQDSRVRLYENKINLGPSLATHRYLELARGKYICPLPSDDAFLPGKLKQQLELLESNPAVGIVGTEVAFINEKDELLDHNRHFASKLFDTTSRSRTAWLRYFFEVGNCLCASSLMIRTELFRRFKPDLRLLQLQDYDSWTRIVLDGFTIEHIRAPLTHYRVRENQGNLSAPSDAVTARSLYESIQVLDRYHSLTRMDELCEIFPELACETVSQNEASYVQHQLAIHSWKLGKSRHRMFSLSNWYRLLGETDPKIAADLQSWGLTPGFFAEKTAQYPLAVCEERTLKRQLRKSVKTFLPSPLRRLISKAIN